jgi:hypothetical protein
MHLMFVVVLGVSSSFSSLLMTIPHPSFFPPSCLHRSVIHLLFLMLPLLLPPSLFLWLWLYLLHCNEKKEEGANEWITLINLTLGK